MSPAPSYLVSWTIRASSGKRLYWSRFSYRASTVAKRTHRAKSGYEEEEEEEDDDVVVVDVVDVVDVESPEEEVMDEESDEG